MKVNNRILIVDDNTDIHDDFHSSLLRQSTVDQDLSELEASLFDDVPASPPEGDTLMFQLKGAYQGDEAILMVETAEQAGKPYAVLFVDVRMPPGIDGIETIYRIWRKYPLIEMVICTAYSDYSWDQIIAKLGATDKLLFLKKPFRPVEVKQMALALIKKWNLNREVNHLVSNLDAEVKERTKQLSELLVELREKNQILSEMAQRDSLTGLFNHGALYSQLNALVSESRRHRYPLSVIMIDIDFFKEINDTFGHPAGDAVLKNVAKLLQTALRLYDISLRVSSRELGRAQEEFDHYNVVGRYGGDEFVVIVPHCDADGARQVAKRICAGFEKIDLPEYPGLTSTPSIGICALDTGVKCDDCGGLIQCADKALYLSKAKGRSSITSRHFEQGENET